MSPLTSPVSAPLLTSPVSAPLLSSPTAAAGFDISPRDSRLRFAPATLTSTTSATLSLSSVARPPRAAALLVDEADEADDERAFNFTARTPDTVVAVPLGAMTSRLRPLARHFSQTLWSNGRSVS